MFRGHFDHTLDPKGRLSIPAKFRDIIAGKGDDRIVVTRFAIGDLKCLDVYPWDEWLRLEEEIRQKPKFERPMLMFQTYYLGAASECSVDSHGRVLIPPALRRHADLKRNVVVVGALDKFRIWDQDAWEKVSENTETVLRENPDFLADLKI